MQYVFIPITQSEGIGISPVAHQTSESEILLSEMELMRNTHLTGTFPERVKQLNTSIHTEQEAERYVIDHHFKIHE